MGKEKKIASIGIAISSWITFHGSALNVNNDLSGFSKIDPCGFKASGMTSMKEELGDQSPSLAQVKESFIKHFSKQFNRLPAQMALSPKGKKKTKPVASLVD